MADPFNLQTDVVRQHTVPRFLLKHFSTPGKGKRQRLYAFDKAAGRAYATTPDDATVRNTFYNLDNHPDRLSLEPLLGIYEHHAAPVIAALLAHRDIRRLTDDERYRLAVFVAVQRARTFGELERISGMISVLTDKMEAIGSTKEQAMETLGLSSGGDTKDIFLRQLVQQVSHIDLLLKKDWYLLETRPERPFYVSDNPVVLKNSNDFGPYGNLGLAVRGIQIYLPLSSTLMLAMYCPSIREQMVFVKSSIFNICSPGRRILSPVTFGLLKDWNISGGIRTIFLCRLPRSMSRITIPCRWSSRSSTCSAVKRISLWLRECWPIVNATGLARGLRFSPNSGLTCAGK
uniref:DUF4238 domain-containing protein n=1 Tax=Escherichia coli TaxID=562 RepID=A0A6D1P2D0_ECOLX|nr:hypothetical protein PGJFMKIC_00067 [Escherichia coli]